MALRRVLSSLVRAAPVASRAVSESVSIPKTHPYLLCRAVRLMAVNVMIDCLTNLYLMIDDVPQVASSAISRAVAADEIAEDAKGAKQGWGQTKIGQVLQAKVGASQRISGDCRGTGLWQCRPHAKGHACIPESCRRLMLLFSAPA